MPINEVTAVNGSLRSQPQGTMQFRRGHHAPFARATASDRYVSRTLLIYLLLYVFEALSRHYQLSFYVDVHKPPPDMLSSGLTAAVTCALRTQDACYVRYSVRIEHVTAVDGGRPRSNVCGRGGRSQKKSSVCTPSMAVPWHAFNVRLWTRLFAKQGRETDRHRLCTTEPHNRNDTVITQ